jgi:beta-carotene 15,15'-dioxygenase
MKNIEVTGKFFGVLLGIVYLTWFEGNETLQWLLFGSILLTIGIPHGALDHLLTHPTFTKKQLITFIVKYVAIIAVYLILWLILPLPALMAFILMSAYHFGQSHYLDISLSIYSKSIYLLTGAFYLAVIFWGDFAYTAEILSGITDISFLATYGPYFIFGLYAATILLLFMNKAKQLLLKPVEMAVLGLLLYQLPLLIGFILYFGFWHALPSMVREYSFMKRELLAKSFLGFIGKLLPFTVLSIVGMLGVLAYLNYQAYENLLLVFFILVSLISAPHIFYMDRFLESDKNQN